MKIIPEVNGHTAAKQPLKIWVRLKSWDNNEINALQLDMTQPPRCNPICFHHFCPDWAREEEPDEMQESHFPRPGTKYEGTEKEIRQGRMQQPACYGNNALCQHIPLETTCCVLQTLTVPLPCRRSISYFLVKAPVTFSCSQRVIPCEKSEKKMTDFFFWIFDFKSQKYQLFLE